MRTHPPTHSRLRSLFWAKVNKFGEIPKHVPSVGRCWMWTACTQGNYGKFALFIKPVAAHRVAYMLFRGEIPRGMFVLHKCDVPLCVRPSHLYIGTHSDNMRDSVNKKRHVDARKLSCIHGHKFTKSNTHIRIRNSRKSRICLRCVLLAGVKRYMAATSTPMKRAARNKAYRMWYAKRKFRASTGSIQ